MNFLKKSATFLWYVVLIVLAVYFVSSDALLSFFNFMKSSDQGPLMAVAKYIKDADSWNYITMILFFGFSIGLFLLFNNFANWLLNKISIRWPKLSFLNSKTADVLIQNPLAAMMLITLFFVGTNVFVSYKGNNMNIENITDIDKPMPVFVLGTSKFLSNGKDENLYYTYRMQAALELWNNGKVKFFILSGDGVGEAHKAGTYDETRDMRNDLIAAGVPEDRIKIDKFGFRTLDSILRLRGIFHLNDVIIVSQGFHTPRALVLSQYYGIKSYGYIAKGSPTMAMLKKEILISRPALIMDILIANMQPRVTGEDGKPIEFREDFEMKSNLHILIVLGLFLGAFILSGGFFVYYSKKTAEDRRRVARKFSLIGSGVLVGVTVMVFNVYKNIDIKFIDEVVEAGYALAGVKSDKMIKKEEVRIEKIKEIEKKEQEFEKQFSAPIVLTKQEAIAPEVANPVIEQPKNEKLFTSAPKENLFNSQVDEAAVKALELKKANEQRIADSLALAATKPKKRNLFNADDSGSQNISGNNESKEIQYFKAKVHNTQTFNNDDVLTFRTSEAVDINGTTIPENFVFTAKANVFEERITFKVKEIKSVAVKGENYTNKVAGMPIRDENHDKNDFIVSDGFTVTFGIIKN